MDLLNYAYDLLNSYFYKGKLSEKRVYAFTNENISGVLKNIDLEDSSILTISSSGDQFFNMALSGIKRVTLVDKNPFSEAYVLGFRYAMILAYSYDEYLWVLDYLYKKNIDLTSEKKIFRDLYSFMPNYYRKIWQEIFLYYEKLKSLHPNIPNLITILTQDSYFNLDELKFNNDYLKSEEQFNILKQKINQIYVKFICGDFFNLSLTEQYDFIFCSNIIEHMNLQNKSLGDVKAMYQIIKEHLNSKGIIFATYMYRMKGLDGVCNYPIAGTDIPGRVLVKENILYIDNYQFPREKDAVLILHK